MIIRIQNISFVYLIEFVRNVKLIDDQSLYSSKELSKTIPFASKNRGRRMPLKRLLELFMSSCSQRFSFEFSGLYMVRHKLSLAGTKRKKSAIKKTREAKTENFSGFSTNTR